mmetsp:Transcript_6834/g.9790  ORF Transcript_6834/g.9790 Transcript_6834/m.9790 type:complete len:89 (-) Transcript_6834:1166-1432(-)
MMRGEMRSLIPHPRDNNNIILSGIKHTPLRQDRRWRSRTNGIHTVLAPPRSAPRDGGDEPLLIVMILPLEHYLDRSTRSPSDSRYSIL